MAMKLNKHDRLMQACKDAIATWGNKQPDIAIEECAELTVAILHHQRGKAERAAVAAEAADCLIVSLQMLLMYSDTEQTADDMLTHKLQRLEGKLAFAKQANTK